MWAHYECSSLSCSPLFASGRSVGGGSLETGSIGEHEYRNTMSSYNSAILLHPSSIPYHSPPLVHGIQGLNYHFLHQIPAPFYRRPMNDNLHHRNARNREDGRESMSSNTQHFYRPRTRLSQYAHVEITGHIRILPSEVNSFLLCFLFICNQQAGFLWTRDDVDTRIYLESFSFLWKGVQ